VKARDPSAAELATARYASVLMLHTHATHMHTWHGRTETP
jgi:hypothetical protein